MIRSGDLLGFAITVCITIGIGVLVMNSRLPRSWKRLACIALALRVLGAWVRYTVLFAVYGGSGDSVAYYNRGLEYARHFWRFDFSPFWDQSLWLRGAWTETSFMSFPSGIVLALFGPSFLGEFVIFSLLSFVGLVGFAVAFHRNHPDVPLQRYLRWIWLFPSLWFWPASVGKEAVMLMGIGLAVAGFVGRKGKVQWPLLIFGAFFVYAIRQEVALVLIFSFIVSYWLSLGGRWTFGRAAQGVVIVGVGLWGMWLSLGRMGVSGFDMEGVQGYMVENEALSDTGTRVDRVGIGLGGAPMAIVNILTRPWPWEATGVMPFLSSVEILAFWGIVWYRRRNVMHALRTWRSHALLRLAIPFIIVYSIALGMLIVNLGIVARQRVFLFPFLFLLLEIAPPPRRKRARGPAPNQVSRPMTPHAPRGAVG